MLIKFRTEQVTVGEQLSNLLVQLGGLSLSKLWELRDKCVQTKLSGHTIWIRVLNNPVTYTRPPIEPEMPLLQCQSTKCVPFVELPVGEPVDAALVKHLELTPDI